MKKKLLLTMALFIASLLTAFGQKVLMPFVAEANDQNTQIMSVETNNNYTIVTFKATAAGDGTWIQVNKEIFLQTDVSNEHFGYVKSDNIPLVPARHDFKKVGETLTFKIYFRKIPAQAKLLDIVERAGPHEGVTYFNYYGVNLNGERPRVTNVTLAPPPPSPGQDVSLGGTEFSEMRAALNNITNSALNNQLNYYNQPGKLAEIAKLNKRYFDELIKAGFTVDQATQLLTATNFLKGVGDK